MRCVVLAATLAAMAGISFGASAQPLTIDANGQARVPQGVYWLDVQVASAGGGGSGSDDGGDGSIGGAGVLITGTISVVPNQVISVVQGKGGSNGGGKQENPQGNLKGGLGGEALPGTTGAGGIGGGANQDGHSGAGGGGGGASMISTTQGLRIVAGGGGGGGGGGASQWLNAIPGKSTDLSAALPGVCGNLENGGPGFGGVALPPQTPPENPDHLGDGGGGGGGGGGAAGGTGGAAGNEDGQAVTPGLPPASWAQGGPGAAGGSCAQFSSANQLNGALSLTAGPAGGPAMSQHVANNTQSNEKGEDGFVQLIPNLDLAPPTQPPAQAVAAVPVNSPIALVLMSMGLGALALGIRRRQQK